MKISLIISLLIFTSFETTHAQYFGVDKQKLEDFRQCSKMKVILTGNDKFDSYLKTALQNYWKIKDVEFVWSETEKDNKMEGSINVEKEGQIYMAVIEYSGSSHFFGTKLMIIDREKPSDKIINSPTLAGSAGINYANPWCLDFVIKGLNDVLTIILDNNMTDLQFKDLAKMINVRAPVVKQKTLLISEKYTHAEEMQWGYGLEKPAIPLEVFRNYPYKIKVEDDTLVNQAINSKDGEYCLFIVVYTELKYIFVYDLETRETVYIARDVGLNVLNLKKFDIDDLVDAADGKK